ncbi:MAG TPA: hypothetical protein PLA68_09250 [Panacibacter sp.]|nr:hypothetical protein [Panacibacter sp.]
MIKIYLIISSCIISLGNVAIAQNNADSCKVFVTNYGAKYHIRVSPENLMYDFNDSSFHVNDSTIYKKILLTFNDGKKYLDDNKLIKPKLNRYSVDCRLLFLFYHGKSYDIIGFGSNGLMMFNDSVYEYKKDFLYKISSIIPELPELLRL